MRPYLALIFPPPLLYNSLMSTYGPVFVHALSNFWVVFAFLAVVSVTLAYCWPLAPQTPTTSLQRLTAWVDYRLIASCTHSIDDSPGAFFAFFLISCLPAGFALTWILGHGLFSPLGVIVLLATGCFLFALSALLANLLDARRTNN